MKKVMFVLFMLVGLSLFGQRVWSSSDVIKFSYYEQNMARFLEDNNYTNYCSAWLRHLVEIKEIDTHASIHSKKQLNWAYQNYNNHVKIHGNKKVADITNLTPFSDWVKSVGAEKSIFSLHCSDEFKLSLAITVKSVKPEFKSIVILEYFGFFEESMFYNYPYIKQFTEIAVQYQDGTWGVLPWDYYNNPSDTNWYSGAPGSYYFFDKNRWNRSN